MKKPKRPRDPNQLAKYILDLAVNETKIKSAKSLPPNSPEMLGGSQSLSKTKKKAPRSG